MSYIHITLSNKDCSNFKKTCHVKSWIIVCTQHGKYCLSKKNKFHITLQKKKKKIIKYIYIYIYIVEITHS